MKRRSFIQGVLALIGATVAAKVLPSAPKPKPQMLTDAFPDGISATKSPLTGQRWVLDPDCDKRRVYYMNQFHVGDRVQFSGHSEIHWLTCAKDAL